METETSDLSSESETSTETSTEESQGSEYNLKVFSVEDMENIPDNFYNLAIVFNTNPKMPIKKRFLNFVKRKEASAIMLREDFITRLRKVGLGYKASFSKDHKNIFVRVGATEDRLCEHAEVMQMIKQLRIQFGSGYECFTNARRHDFHESEPDSIFSSAERALIIKHIIQSPKRQNGAGMDLDEAKSGGVINQHFALHDEEVKDFLIREWVWKFWRPQPLDLVRSYFGESIAFYFAWLGFYTKWLVPLTIVGLLVTILVLVENVQYFYGTYYPIYYPVNGTLVEGTERFPTLASYSSLSYSFFIAIFCTFFTEFWKRKSSTYAYIWGVHDLELSEISRLDYKGDQRTGTYRGNVFIDLSTAPVIKRMTRKPTALFYPLWRRKLKMTISIPFVLSLCLVVIFTLGTTMALKSIMRDLFYDPNDPDAVIDEFADPNFFTPTNIFRYTITNKVLLSIVGGLFNAITINIFNSIYRHIAVFVTNWENHRTRTDYEDNLIVKTFLFEFVNSYSSLYYLAFVKRWGVFTAHDEECDIESFNTNPLNGACLNDLAIQLFMLILVKITLQQVIEITFPLFTSRLKMLYSFVAGFIRGKGAKRDIRFSSIESQSKLGVYSSTFDDYNEMIIQYGYVTLFAAAFPLAPLFALINNIIEIRSDAFKILTSYQRPIYKRADGIGTWFEILEAISFISVITNIGIFAIEWIGSGIFVNKTAQMLFLFTRKDYSADLTDLVWQKLLIALVIEHCLLLLKIAIQYIIPDVPKGIQQRIAMDDYIQELLLVREDLRHAVKAGIDLEEESDEEWVDVADERVELEIEEEEDIIVAEAEVQMLKKKQFTKLFMDFGVLGIGKGVHEEPEPAFNGAEHFSAIDGELMALQSMDDVGKVDSNSETREVTDIRSAESQSDYVSTESEFESSRRDSDTSASFSNKNGEDGPVFEIPEGDSLGSPDEGLWEEVASVLSDEILSAVSSEENEGSEI